MKAMVQMQSNKRLKELGYHMLLQIHDELIIEGPEVHKDEALGNIANRKHITLYL